MKAVQRMLRLILCILYIFLKISLQAQAEEHRYGQYEEQPKPRHKPFFSFFEKALVSNVKSSALFELEVTVEVHSPDKLNKLHTIAARNNLLDFSHLSALLSIHISLSVFCDKISLISSEERTTRILDTSISF